MIIYCYNVVLLFTATICCHCLLLLFTVASTCYHLLLLAAAISCGLGSIFLCIALNFEFLVLGRVLLGFGCGAAMMTAPMYISELVPPVYRGKLVGIADVCINVGILCGYLVSFIIEEAFDYAYNWRIKIGRAHV